MKRILPFAFLVLTSTKAFGGFCLQDGYDGRYISQDLNATEWDYLEISGECTSESVPQECDQDGICAVQPPKTKRVRTIIIARKFKAPVWADQLEALGVRWRDSGEGYFAVLPGFDSYSGLDELYINYLGNGGLDVGSYHVDKNGNRGVTVWNSFRKAVGDEGRIWDSPATRIDHGGLNPRPPFGG